MVVCKQYRFGFDIWTLVLFMAVMTPTIIWAFVSAPNDILRTESATPAVDTIASILQFMAVASLCAVINKEAGKVRLSPLVILPALCVLIYYAGWVVYYCGISAPRVILMMTVPPCLALILYAADRKNLPAAILASGFAICHLIFAFAKVLILNGDLQVYVRDFGKMPDDRTPSLAISLYKEYRGQRASGPN